jgi:hypothetical protein
MPPQRRTSQSDDGFAWYWKLAYAVGTSAFLVAAIILSWITDQPAQFLGAALGVIAISTFVTFYAKCSDIDIRMRTAIAASVIVTFLAFFSLVVFSPPLQQASKAAYPETQEDAAETRNQETNTRRGSDSKADDEETVPTDLFKTFSWVTVTVVGFYFGGRTVEKALGKDKKE